MLFHLKQGQKCLQLRKNSSIVLNLINTNLRFSWFYNGFIIPGYTDESIAYICLFTTQNVKIFSCNELDLISLVETLIDTDNV